MKIHHHCNDKDNTFQFINVLLLKNILTKKKVLRFEAFDKDDAKKAAMTLVVALREAKPSNRSQLKRIKFYRGLIDCFTSP